MSFQELMPSGQKGPLSTIVERMKFHGGEREDLAPTKVAARTPKNNWGVVVDGKVVEITPYRSNAITRAGILGGKVKKMPAPSASFDDEGDHEYR